MALTPCFCVSSDTFFQAFPVNTVVDSGYPWGGDAWLINGSPLAPIGSLKLVKQI